VAPSEAPWVKDFFTKVPQAFLAGVQPRLGSARARSPLMLSLCLLFSLAPSLSISLSISLSLLFLTHPPSSVA
jgi:hypothetical protein